MQSERIDQCVESICQKGCKAITDDIDALEKGVIPNETASLNGSERVLVLEELKSIMSVYDSPSKP